MINAKTTVRDTTKPRPFPGVVDLCVLLTCLAGLYAFSDAAGSMMTVAFASFVLIPPVGVLMSMPYIAGLALLWRAASLALKILRPNRSGNGLLAISLTALVGIFIAKLPPVEQSCARHFA
jgi:hypothetical protein